MEELVFNYLAERMNSQVSLNAYPHDNPGEAGREYSNAIISLCSKGLLRLMPGGPGQTEIIVKTEEFYHANALGFDIWNFKYNRKIEREQRIEEWNLVYFQFRSKAAKYWWVSLPLSLIAIAISIYQAFND